MSRERFAEDLKAAMKSKDRCRVSTLRLIVAALKDRDIAARGNGDDGIDEAAIEDMLAKMIRQRRESVKLYEEAGRLDLSEQEAREITVIEDYLPKQFNEEEIDRAVHDMISELGACGVKDMGRTMAALKTTYGGCMDFSKASGIVKSYLAGAR